MRRYLPYGVFFLCFYSAWALGGVDPSLQWPMVPMGLLLLYAAFFARAEHCPRYRARLLHDPVFYAGLAFLCLLVIQWINGGYAVDLQSGVPARSGVRPWRWFPWSTSRWSAAEMWGWFVPAWTVLVVVRSALRRREIKKLLYLLAWNSALLALFGIVQRVLDADKILGIRATSRTDFFASFIYPNHGAAWFYLHGALAAGLMYHAIVKRKPMVRAMVWGGCLLLCTVAGFLTLSRVGVLVATIMMGVVLFAWKKKVLEARDGRLAANVNITLVLAGLIGLTLFLGVGKGSLAKEFVGKSLVGERSLAKDLAGRGEHVARALGIGRDYPLFGVGGWGCDELADLYIPEAEQRSWMVNGRANVHCDPVQFLAEFGILGSLCMGAVLVALVTSASMVTRNALSIWMMSGLAAVFVHGLIDLPFRCPAVLMVWCFLFAALPCIARPRESHAGAEPTNSSTEYPELSTPSHENG